VKKKRVAIIGGGQIAENVHLPYYRTRQDVEITAVLGRDIDNTKAFANRNQIPNYYLDLKEMLIKESPDMVSVCTPNKFHYDFVMEALKHKCDVLCEKPPAITAKQALEMYELADKNNCVLAYNFHHRYSENAKVLREKVKQGVLGEIYAIKALALRRSGVPGWGHFTNKKMQGGGPLIDIGIHMLDSVMYILGFPKVEKVTAKMFQKIGPYKSEGAFGKWDPENFEVEDSFFGFIELEGGNLLQIDTSYALHIKEKSIMNVEFYGEKAGATLYPAQIYTDNKGEFVSIYENENLEENLSVKGIEAFVDRCFGKDVMIVDGWQGYIIQHLIESLYQSAETGESIYL
jgi:predicted dehydrogenase